VYILIIRIVNTCVEE